MHQCLHQITESGERSAASVLLDAIAETLGTDAAGRLLAALERQAEAVARTE
ncbi:hypothetical protein FHS27_004905 [Rhodopirellula rubra]|uniref:Uncharacterized protein n=1 Tax=Aporhodopirellula rubra TaxID=980271 RepID=A0A7W5E2K7_9BACT|nr:hypothetical protein [Aporhodopirellula rubra]MBB3209069.1 hypothetical protein [Aporhodopirellula rubra]